MRMPRKRVFKNRAFVGFILEGEHLELLDSIARREGISRSELCRRVILEWLEGEVKEKYGFQLALQGNPPRDDPPDPLIEVDVEEFEQQLQKLEEEVAQLEKAVDQAVKSGHGYGYFAGSQLSELNNMAWKLVEKWHSMRKWYYRLRGDLPRERALGLSSRMAALKKKLNTLLEKTRSRRW